MIAENSPLLPAGTKAEALEWFEDMVLAWDVNGYQIGTVFPDEIHESGGIGDQDEDFGILNADDLISAVAMDLDFLQPERYYLYAVTTTEPATVTICGSHELALTEDNTKYRFHYLFEVLEGPQG